VRERERVCMCLLEKMCERERTKRSKKFGYKKQLMVIVKFLNDNDKDR
jgi:hypothetical protein